MAIKILVAVCLVGMGVAEPPVAPYPPAGAPFKGQGSFQDQPDSPTHTITFNLFKDHSPRVKNAKGVGANDISENTKAFGGQGLRGYGSSRSPQSNYGAPSQPSSNYGVPRQPSTNYGAPSSSNFGKSSNFRAPSSNYGAPSEPSSNYGAPSQPSSNYGAPSQPSSNYGAPGKSSSVYDSSRQSPAKSYQPSQEYGTPDHHHHQQTPSADYGVPSSSPSSKYGPPSNTYGAPSFQPSMNHHHEASLDKSQKLHQSSFRTPKPVYGAPFMDRADNGYAKSGYEGADSSDEKSEPANYEFEYQVHGDNTHSHEESREGDDAWGSYRVQLPDGRTQLVEYTADNRGFRPRISYIDENAAAQGPY